MPDLLELVKARDVAVRRWNTFSWDGISDELAALIEAGDEMADDRDTLTDSGAAGRYDTARAALAAKLEASR